MVLYRFSFPFTPCGVKGSRNSETTEPMTRKQKTTLRRLVHSSSLSPEAIAQIEKRSGMALRAPGTPIAVGEGEAEKVPEKAKTAKKTSKKAKKAKKRP